MRLDVTSSRFLRAARGAGALAGAGVNRNRAGRRLYGIGS
jgi:hypothetical protein